MTGASRQPLSWLLLERYALDELGPDERAAVEVRLGESADDRALLARIRGERVLLPPLSAHRAARGPRVGLWATGALALAASLLLARVSLQDGGRELGGDVTKGGELTLTLVSELHGGTPHTFTPGERFKVRVTCSTEQAGELAVLVFQGGERFQPLLGSARCGENLALWPGAFTLDGDGPADVCVAAGPALGSARSAAHVAGHGACVRLERAR